MADRYPSQDLSDSLDGYLWDFEQLAIKHTLPVVQDALAALRVRAGQSFFPRPDEVAEEIEHQMESVVRERENERKLQERQNEIERFWQIAPFWIEKTGESEEELLKRFPSMRGTKPQTEAA